MFARFSRLYSGGVFPARAVLNTSLTIGAQSGRARQIFGPKFTISHTEAGYHGLKAIFGKKADQRFV
jgi:hypothetical protein